MSAEIAHKRSLDDGRNLSAVLPKAELFDAELIAWGYRERSAVFAADIRPDKLDLGAGVFLRDDGRLPVFEALNVARGRIDFSTNHGYPPPAGLPLFRNAINEFIFGADLIHERPGSLISIQTIGAAGALALGADVLSSLAAEARERKAGAQRFSSLAENLDRISIDRETWGAHSRILDRAGMTVSTHRYLSPTGTGVDRLGILNAIEELQPGSVVLLQACCHNPTGYDLSQSDWSEILTLIQQKQLLPFFDVAYPGISGEIEDDLQPVRECVRRGMSALVATSCCKLFSTYDARVGALSIVAATPEIAERLESRVKDSIQASYSSPPRAGAEVIATVVLDAALKANWLQELKSAGEELTHRRHALVRDLRAFNAPSALLEIENQRGLFAWTGLTRDSCKRLTQEFGIYLPSNGRVCIGAIPLERIEYVALALATVAREDTQLRAISNQAEILLELKSSILASPKEWLATSDLVSYAQRQATSCTYLEVLFPAIIASSPKSMQAELALLFDELTLCHRRQSKDLSTIVDVPTLENRSSYYFDTMYRCCGVPDIDGDSRLDGAALLRLLSVHAVSYLRGAERYDLLKEFGSPENVALAPVWHRFSFDAPRNAELALATMLRLFSAEEVRSELLNAMNQECQVMTQIWRRAGIDSSAVVQR